MSDQIEQIVTALTGCCAECADRAEHIAWAIHEHAPAGLLATPERAAKVREAARAEALAGFEWVEPKCEHRSHSINCDCYGPLDRPRQGRWIGPWEPTP